MTLTLMSLGVALLIAATWHLLIKRFWLASALSGITGAVIGLIEAQPWRTYTPRDVILIFVILGLNAFILALGVGIPFKRYRARKSFHG